MSQEPYQFVISSVRSDEERRRNSQLARAHAARVNRQKRKSVRRVSKKDESAAKAIPAIDESLESAESAELWFELWSNESASSRNAVSEAGSEAQSVGDESVTVIALPQTISPVFGAFATNTSDLNSPRSNASLDYCQFFF